MRGLGLVLFFLGSFSAAVAEASWVILDPTALEADWQRTVEALAANHLVRADFVEERRSRLRPRPARFEGNLIYSREAGLSLFYDAVITSTVILDEEGVLRRSLDGERALPVPMEEGGLHELILLIFALDLPALDPHFVIEGKREEDGAWALRLTPRDGAKDLLEVTRVLLEGSDGVVEKIQLLRRGGLDLRILLENHVLNPVLEAAEREARFR